MSLERCRSDECDRQSSEIVSLRRVSCELSSVRFSCVSVKNNALLWYLQDGAALCAKRAVCVVEPLLKEQQDLTAWLSLPTLPPAAAGSAGHSAIYHLLRDEYTGIE